MDQLNVACVLKSGGDYDADHVGRLAAHVKKYLSVPHRFVCLSDIEVPCEHIPLKHGWPGWWSKIELFRNGIFKGKVFYLDLDTVIISPIDDLALARHRFTMLHSMSRPTHPGSGVMSWSTDLSKIYRIFLRNPKHWMKHCTTSECWGDQGFIFAHTPEHPDYWQDRFPGRIVSYKMHCRPNGGRVPHGASIVAYHGRPRPWEAPLR